MSESRQPVILTIDSESIIRNSIKSYLEDSDYTVLEAENGTVGLELFNANVVDLILVDLRLPQMDGLEVLAKVRAVNDNMPVIVVSGTGEIRDVVEALHRGAWDFLLKPIDDMSILVHAIEKGLERARLRRDNERYQNQLEQRFDSKTRELSLVNSRLREVVESTKRLLGCGELQESGQVILEEFGRHMNARGGSIYHVTEQGLQLLHSLDPGHASSFLSFPLRANSPFHEALKADEPFFVSDIEQEEGLEKSGWKYYFDNSILFLPIKDRAGATIAIVALHNKGKPPFIAQDREIGAILASYASEVLQTAQAEAALKQSEKFLRQAQKMEAIGTLAGGIAHDFNNILSAIVGYTDLSLYAGNLDPKITSNLKHIKTASERAKDLVRQILSFSRTEEFQEKAVDIGPIIQEVLKLLRAIIPTSIDIKHEIGEGLGKIITDPTRIHQVLMNLCTNAAHAMAEGEGEITIRYRKLSRPEFPEDLTEIEGNSCICLSVQDNGSGIEPELLSRIFDPYFTTKQTGEGTGLGLAVVHGIVRSSGGAIRVFSKVGKGSIFFLYFPLDSGVNDSQQKAISVPMPHGKERILFVDDEPTLANVVGEMLEKLGYYVEIQTSSVGALELFKQVPERYDLLITDQTMPVLSGVEFAREALSIKPDIPVILYTGYSTAIDEKEARKIGIREFLMKPVSMTNLATVVRNVLDQ